MACIAAYIFVSRRQQVDIPIEEVRIQVMKLVSSRRQVGRMQRESVGAGGADNDDDEETCMDDDDPDYVDEGSGGREQGEKVLLEQMVHENGETGAGNNGDDIGGKEAEVVTTKKRKFTEETSIATATMTTTTVGWSADSATANVKVSRNSNGDVNVAFTSAQAGTVTINSKVSHELQPVQ